MVLFLTEGSTYAESTDDSVYESDSTFYKHTEGKWQKRYSIYKMF